MKKCPSCGLEEEEVAALRERLKEAEELIGTIPGHTNIPDILKRDAQIFLDKAKETEKLKPKAEVKHDCGRNRGSAATLGSCPFPPVPVLSAPRRAD